MIQSIFKLPDEVINKIAAGEVVENPASLIKELIENSLDARALHIQIDIEEGGEKKILVEDDGIGMNREDALLSLERHATSKLKSIEDLETIQTLGFRGEALAAIGAVSYFKMTTSDGSIATSIEMEGGVVKKITPSARNRGTTIEVLSLFFNVPARKKFLKSARANTSLIIKTIETTALAHPEVVFTLTSNGEILFQTEKQSWEERAEAILGPLPFKVSFESVYGLLGSPSQAKPQRRNQYLFINQRPIFSPLIAKAVKAAYGTRLEEHSYPSFLLFLTLSGSDADINVHPQKKEVRFSNEKGIFSLFEKAAALSLGNEMKMASFDTPLAFSNSFEFHPEEKALPWEQPTEKPLTFTFQIDPRPLAILEKFCLFQTEQLILVNLESARARILFESFERHNPASFQILICPIELDVKEDDMVHKLETIGIECRWIQKHKLAVDSIPCWMSPEDFIVFFHHFQADASIPLSLLESCRKSVRSYTLEDAKALWSALDRCQEKNKDPEGRSIWIPIEAKHFKPLFI